MSRFYADENFPRPIVSTLRGLGHDVLTAYEDGKANQKVPDDEVLNRATELGRAVLSMNRRDFARLHDEQPSHAGIVLCKYEVGSMAQANRIHEAVANLEKLDGELIRIQKPAT